MSLSTTARAAAPISPADVDLPRTEPIDITQVIRDQLAAEALVGAPAGNDRSGATAMPEA